MNGAVVYIATLVGIIESSMFMFCGFRLVGFVPTTKSLLAAGAVHAVLVRLSRHLFYSVWDVVFSAHILVALALFFTIGYWGFRLSAFVSLAATVLGFMILLVGTMGVLLFMPNVTPPLSTTQVLGFILLEQSPLLVATVIIARTGFSIVPRRVAERLGASEIIR